MPLRLLSLAALALVFLTGLVWWGLFGANLAVGVVRRFGATRSRSHVDGGRVRGHAR